MIIRILAIAALYYPLSIGLTFYQKWLLKNYKFPLMVVCGHYLIKYGAAIFIRFLCELCGPRRVRLSWKEQLRWLAPIGICASLDIGLSNWALEYVTVSLYTMAKSSGILFIVAFSLLLRLEKWRISLGMEAAFIASGLFLFTWRSSQLDLTGLLLVELAAACTGVRWSVSQLVMQNEDNHAIRNPLDMVAHVQPWMLIPIVPLILMFEGSKMSVIDPFVYQGEYAPLTIFALVFIGGMIALSMELAEYLLLVQTSGMTLSVFGIIKEVFTLLLAHFAHGDQISGVNLIGLLVCMGGVALHGMNRHRQHSRLIASKAKAKSSFSAEDLDLMHLLDGSDEGNGEEM
ncbi:unnamed protein product, partial [Mesorhabditis belari]|uniref:Sugar phosphate transporter domain-containing protein n=1 Tax=Mesorhabditis belari TaxID=2138241 RepID=A0AAF3EDG6_9BILA